MMKKGISLIVLVITVIVMIILATSVMISLTNADIINKANEATNKNNIKQVEQLVAMAWADAYADGERDVAALQSIVDAVLIKNNLTDKYVATATAKGVTVVEK